MRNLHKPDIVFFDVGAPGDPGVTVGTPSIVAERILLEENCVAGDPLRSLVERAQTVHTRANDGKLVDFSAQDSAI